MPDPTLQEFCGIYSLQTYRPDVFRRHQRYVRDVIQPQLDDRERLIAENAELQAQLDALTKKPTRKPAEAVVG